MPPSREDVLKSIRSVLVSLGCTTNRDHNQVDRSLSVKQLSNDFMEFIGYPIPFREMGYSNIEDFLRDIPSVVSVQYKVGQLHVQAVSDGSLSKLEKLIGRQRESNAMARKTVLGHGHVSSAGARHNRDGRNRRGRGPPRRSGPGILGPGPGAYRPPRRYSAPYQPQGPYRQPYQGTAHQSYQATPHQPYRPPPKPHEQPPPAPTVPPMIRGYIKDILVSYPNGLIGSNFDLVFQRNYGKPLVPQRLGFMSLTDLLKSLPEVVHLEQLPTGGYKLHAKRLEPRRGAALKGYQGT